MATPNQIAGKHFMIYEAYYKQADPKDAGRIEAMEAAKFLKKSGLSVVVLSRIWDLSDPSGRGFLDKTGFYIAMKLVALAQMGTDLNMTNIQNETMNPPKLGDLPKISASSIQAVPPTTNLDWSIKPADKRQYEELFESLKPVENMLPGNKVKGVLMESKLPLDTLGRIWELADQDKDGNLDKFEFVVAMHLVYQALAKKAIPLVLPPELKRQTNNDSINMLDDNSGGFIANFPAELPPPPVPPLPVSIPPAVPPLPRLPPAVPPMTGFSAQIQAPLVAAPVSSSSNHLPSNDWVVTTIEKLKYDEIFNKSDLDKDGLVSGLEIKDIFLQSGVPQNCLALIWSLCDTNSTGKLNADQFALALWLVDRKKKGFEPPVTLELNMIPPSMRTQSAQSSAASDLLKESQPAYSNPELEMIAKEIEEILKEKRQLENEVYHKEAEIRVKSGEVRSLQSELDTLAATLKQLENQKGEAQKRLDDLKQQSENLHEEVGKVNDEILGARVKVNKIREQCTKQEETIKEQETELDSKKSDLQKLKDEETSLEKEYQNSCKELESLTTNLQDTQLQFSQIRAMVTQLQENQRQMNDAVNAFKAAIDIDDPSMVSDYSLKLNPEFKEVQHQWKEITELKPATPEKNASFQTNGFRESSTAFKGNGAFGDDGFGAHNTGATGFDDDSFGASFNAAAPSSSAADPFRDKENQMNNNNTADDFESDPFAILHAPTSSSSQKSNSSNHNLNTSQHAPPRSESPSPALPPKKAKQPPPRPAPPRPLQGPTPTKLTPSDGFGESNSFADFDAFDNKKPVADFVDDPFKDYRYEDVFNIEDPFADEDLEPTTSNSITNKSSSKRDEFFSANSKDFSSSNDLLNNNKQLVDNFKSLWQSEELPAATRMEKNDLSKNTNEFEVNNNFANFSVFADKSTTSPPKDPFAVLDKRNNNHNTSNSTTTFNADLFASFNNNFDSSSTTSTINKNASSKVSANSAVFDAFGDASGLGGFGSSVKPSFDEEEDSFGADFGKALNGSGNTGENTKRFRSLNKLDAFNKKDLKDGSVVTNLNGKSKKVDDLKKANNNTPLSNAKYSEDYSKSFDTDLEEALKRSLYDQ